MIIHPIAVEIFQSVPKRHSVGQKNGKIISTVRRGVRDCCSSNITQYYYSRYNMCKIITVSWQILLPFYDPVIITTQSNNYSSKKLQLTNCATYWGLPSTIVCVCEWVCVLYPADYSTEAKSLQMTCDSRLIA